MAIIPPIDVVSGYVNEDATPRMTTLPFTATDGTVKDTVAIANRLLLIFNNTNVAAQTVTIASNNDSFGRLADIDTFSVPPSGFVSIILDRPGWEIAGNIEVTSGSPDIEMVAINL